MAWFHVFDFVRYFSIFVDNFDFCAMCNVTYMTQHTTQNLYVTLFKSYFDGFGVDAHI